MNIKELREKAQKGKVAGRERPWFYKTLQRGPSIYITAVLRHTPLSPNSITLLGILAGVIGAFLLTLPAPYWFFIGILTFYLNILLDKVDGEIARLKNRITLRGVFLDEINHLVVPSLFFIGFMMRVLFYSPITGRIALFVILAGIAAALTMSFIRTGWGLAPQIFAKKFMKHPEYFPLPERQQDTVGTAKRKYTIIVAFLGIVHQFQEFFMILLVFFIAGLIQLFIAESFIHFVLIGYGILLPLIFIENIIKGYLSIDSTVRALRDRFLT